MNSLSMEKEYWASMNKLDMVKNIEDLKIIYEITKDEDCFMDCPVKLKNTDLSTLEFFFKINNYKMEIISGSLFVSNAGNKFLNRYGIVNNDIQDNNIRQLSFDLLISNDLIESFSCNDINIYMYNIENYANLRAKLLQLKPITTHKPSFSFYTIFIYQENTYTSTNVATWKLFDIIQLKQHLCK